MDTTASKHLAAARRTFQLMSSSSLYSSSLPEKTNGWAGSDHPHARCRAENFELRMTSPAPDDSARVQNILASLLQREEVETRRPDFSLITLVVFIILLGVHSVVVLIFVIKVVVGVVGQVAQADGDHGGNVGVNFFRTPETTAPTLNTKSC